MSDLKQLVVQRNERIRQQSGWFEDLFSFENVIQEIYPIDLTIQNTITNDVPISPNISTGFREKKYRKNVKF